MNTVEESIANSDLPFHNEKDLEHLLILALNHILRIVESRLQIDQQFSDILSEFQISITQVLLLSPE